MDSVTGCSVCE